MTTERVIYELLMSGSTAVSTTGTLLVSHVPQCAAELTEVIRLLDNDRLAAVLAKLPTLDAETLDLVNNAIALGNRRPDSRLTAYLVSHLDHPAESVRESSALALPMTSDPLSAGRLSGAIPLMRSLSETGGVSLAVALGESGGESFAALQAMARSERVPDRIAATAGLRRLAIHDSAAGEILTKLLSDEDRRVRNRSARVLGELGASSEAAVEVLTDWLQTGELDEQRLALQVLGSFGPSAAVSIKKVVSCLDNPRLADDAASTLGRMAPSSLSELASRLGHEATRPQAIRALGVAGAEARDVAPALVELLRLGDQLVACETAAALWRMGVESQKAFDVLMDGCGGSALEALAFPPLDRTPPREEILAGFRLAKVRAQCIRAAIRMGPRMVPALISGLEEKDVMVRRSACRALATAARDLDTAVEGLLRAARDPDEQVRSYAAHGLRTVGVTCDDRLEVEVWSAIEAEASEGVKVALIGALGRSGCGSNVTISRLESMLDAESGPIRKEALNVLVALQAGARVRIERQNRAGVDPTP